MMILTVGELIKELQKYDPNYEIGIDDADTNWELKIEKIIEGGSPNRILISGRYFRGRWGE